MEDIFVHHRHRVMRFVLGVLMLLYDVLWVWMLIYPIYQLEIYPLMTWWTASQMFWLQMFILFVFFTFGLGFAVYCLAFGVCLILDR